MSDTRLAYSIFRPTEITWRLGKCVHAEPFLVEARPGGVEKCNIYNHLEVTNSSKATLDINGLHNVLQTPAVQLVLASNLVCKGYLTALVFQQARVSLTLNR
jgi:hypothetical protein